MTGHLEGRWTWNSRCPYDKLIVLNLSLYARRALVAVRMGSFRVCTVSGGCLQGFPAFGGVAVLG